MVTCKKAPQEPVEGEDKPIGLNLMVLRKLDCSQAAAWLWTRGVPWSILETLDLLVFGWEFEISCQGEKSLPWHWDFCWTLAMQLCNKVFLEAKPTEATGRPGDCSDDTQVPGRLGSSRSGRVKGYLYGCWRLSVILVLMACGTVSDITYVLISSTRSVPCGLLDSFCCVTCAEVSFHKKRDLSSGAYECIEFPLPCP